MLCIEKFDIWIMFHKRKLNYQFETYKKKKKVKNSMYQFKEGVVFIHC